MTSKFKETEIGFIPDEWELVNLGDIGDLKNGVNFNRNDFGDGYPVINVKNLYSGRYATIENLNEIKEGTINNIKDYKLQKGDLLFARSSVKASGAGQVAMVNKLPKNETLFSGFIIRFRNTSNEVDYNFLNYQLRSPIFRRFLTGIAIGTTITNLTQTILSNMPIILPSFEEQMAIGDFLSSIDKKIELNQKMNQTLEEIGQAIFKQWFVYFEFPNEEGKPYKSSGGEMVDSELGEIPKGWNVSKIQHLVNHSKKSINPSLNPYKIFLHYSIPAFDSGKTPLSELGNSIRSNKFIIKPNSVLVSKLNPETPRIWYTRNVDYNSVCSTELQVLVSKKNEYYSFIYYLLNSNYVKETMESMVTGTSKSHQRIRPSDLLNIEIIIPSEKLFSIFEDQIKDLNKLIQNNISQNVSLAKIRDSLLPKLMSGKIRVPLEEK